MRVNTHIIYSRSKATTKQCQIFKYMPDHNFGSVELKSFQLSHEWMYSYIKQSERIDMTYDTLVAFNFIKGLRILLQLP